jgi:hypothetical protein
MNLAQYFENTRGAGILATADSEGKVDLAIYTSPEVIDDNTIAFNMLERLSYKNLQTNPHAAYMFVEESSKWNGRRFYLTKISEQSGLERVRELRSRNMPLPDAAQMNKKFVCFKVENIRPVVGDDN